MFPEGLQCHIGVMRTAPNYARSKKRKGKENLAEPICSSRQLPSTACRSCSSSAPSAEPASSDSVACAAVRESRSRPYSTPGGNHVADSRKTACLKEILLLSAVEQVAHQRRIGEPKDTACLRRRTGFAGSRTIELGLQPPPIGVPPRMVRGTPGRISNNFATQAR